MASSHPERVEHCRESWGIPATAAGEEAAAFWYHVVSRDSFFSLAFQIPYAYNGQPGVLVACSTAESTRIQAKNQDDLQSVGCITEPSFLFYEVWFYAGLAVLNFSGLTDPQHNPVSIGLLGDVLHKVCMEKGVRDWKKKYCMLDGGQIIQPLRRILGEVMEIRNWIEYSCGYSWHAYCGLDLYVRVVSQNQTMTLEEAWYLLNTERPPMDRYPSDPTRWYLHRNLQSYGQREGCIGLWVDRVGQINVSGKSQERMRRIHAHLAPGMPLALPAPPGKPGIEGSKL